MGRPPIYDRAALKLTNDEQKKYEKNGISITKSTICSKKFY